MKIYNPYPSTPAPYLFTFFFVLFQKWHLGKSMTIIRSAIVIQIIIVNFIWNLTYHNFHRDYEIIEPFYISIINYATSYCIYLITCKNCPVQYVGETGQALRDCGNLHRSSICNSQKFNSCKILCDHYQKGV